MTIFFILFFSMLSTWFVTMSFMNKKKNFLKNITFSFITLLCVISLVWYEVDNNSECNTLSKYEEIISKDNSYFYLVEQHIADDIITNEECNELYSRKKKREMKEINEKTKYQSIRKMITNNQLKLL